MATKTWSQSSGNLASTDANWSGGAKPVAGDDIVFDATSTAACTWDLAITCGTFTIAAAYSGTITVTADFGMTDFSLASGSTGTFAPGTKVITCSGNWSKIGGTVTNQTLLLTMTGTGKTLRQLTTLNMLTITGSVALTAQNTSTFNLNMGNGASLTIPTGLIFSLYWYMWAGFTFIGTGQVITTGTGLFVLMMTNEAKTFPASGTGFQNAAVRLTTSGAEAAPMVASLAAATTFGSLEVLSGHATTVLTLDTTIANYALNTGALTIGVRAVITGNLSKIVSSSLTESGASSVFTQGGILIVEGTAAISNGAWAVNENATVDALSQTGGTITVAAGKVLYYEQTLSQTGGSSSGTIAQFQARKQPPIQTAVSRPVDVTNL